MAATTDRSHTGLGLDAGERVHDVTVTAVSPDRGIGEFALVEALPDVAIVVLAAVTHFADPWFLFGLLALGYWLADDRVASDPRASGATAIAIVACGYAAVSLGKVAFAVPRPPGAAAVASSDVPTWLPILLVGWFEGQLVSDGFGFPSGHATGAVVGYGSLALLWNRIGRRRLRLVLAAGIAVGVSLSRIAIGVHYVVDVVAGALVGTAVVVGGLWIAGGSPLRSDTGGSAPPGPTPVFLCAAFVSLLAAGVAVAGGHVDEVVEAAIGIGTGVGGALGWRFADESDPPLPMSFVVPALVATGGLWMGAFALGNVVSASALTAAIATTLATSVAVVGVIVMPSLVGRVSHTDKNA